MDSEQGFVYSGFIADQLGWERARQASLDERGGKLQQAASLTAGLIVAALGALTGATAELNAWSLGLFVGTIIILALAFLFGVLTTRLVDYEVADTQTLRHMTDDHWKDNVVDSRSVVAWLNATTIASLRQGNNFKASRLHRGIVCQGIGVALGAATFAAAAVPKLT
ncbi:hypothetical protein SAMN04489867_1676 [Pedococcus dokdonensis]|uniref:Uncharacterized protein n=1 Tax=Pedococcus dokdonensis TaxID=443156 RepID=A0A1H0QNZ3_9MICO|nr:hypothetical protein [Pedococcus dokdonensis]SDP18910.1 hypothetical protein SAMN04489867_1676 [Pedococcus dokdonensis]